MTCQYCKNSTASVCPNCAPQAPSTEWGRITKLIEPKIEEIKARYPKDLNINGFEPALTSDIVEFCEYVLAAHDKEIVKKIKNLPDAYTELETESGDYVQDEVLPAKFTADVLALFNQDQCSNG